MELMTKYQYTYFIYPYVIDNSKYNKYIQKLLRDKKCKLRIFERARDMNLYQYFSPDIKDYMFWSFELDREAIRNFDKLDIALKSNLLAEHDCNIFEYELSKDLQGKIGERNGIFFDINDIKIVCYKTGVCFLIFKTSLLDSKEFSDILNFNYKFREVNSQTYNLKQYENIKLQSDIFKDVREISSLIKDITGVYNEKNRLNFNDEELITYSYCCLDQDAWKKETDSESIDNLFEKYRMFFPASKQLADSVQNRDDMQIYENKYIRYGISNTGTVLLTSDVNTSNYTTVSQKYENEFLYTYILELYKEMLLQKMSSNFNKSSSFKKVEKEFLDFTKKLWIQETTNDEIGKILSKKWSRNLGVEEIFLKLKNKYDILYKQYNIEKTSDKNGKVVVAMVITIIIGVINLIILLGK